MLDLGPPATLMAALIDRIGDHQLARPTPCGETSVGELVAHVIGLSVAFRDAAAKVDGPTTSTPPTRVTPELPDHWRQIASDRLAELVQSWRDPAAWDGMTQAGGITMPGAVTAIVANDELVLHGWDLAVATGQPFEVAEPNLEASWQMISQTPDTPEARQGLFGPVLAVPVGAPLLDRVLGGAGRNPRWAPAVP